MEEKTLIVGRVGGDVFGDEVEVSFLDGLDKIKYHLEVADFEGEWESFAVLTAGPWGDGVLGSYLERHAYIL